MLLELTCAEPSWDTVTVVSPPGTLLWLDPRNQAWMFQNETHHHYDLDNQCNQVVLNQIKIYLLLESIYQYIDM